MKITYVTYDTELWGGICVVFQHLELLAEAGHEVFLTTPTDKPNWYPLKVPLHKIERLEPSLIPSADIIVATSWMTVMPAVESKKGIAVHLCQGYEGNNKEYLYIKDEIDKEYSRPIPKLVVSPHMERFLKDRFNVETYYIGQILNHDIFYPSEDTQHKKDSPFNILVVGPFEADVKNIPVALKGISHAKKMLNTPISLIRVSQFPISREEEEIIKPDAYHCHIPYTSMGEIYRSADIYISISKEAEGFGLPALEAMACGVPTILSRIPSYISFDEKQDYALFIEPSDAESVARAIEEIHTNMELRERLIQRGLEIASGFTKEKLTERLISAFEEIMKRDKLAKTRKAWNDYHLSMKPGQKIHWWDSPLIMEHCQRLVTGDSKTDIYTFLRNEFIRNTLKRGLSICSGSGEFERGLIDNGICKSIDAYEVAEERATAGMRMAEEKNYDITFYIEDVNTARFRKNYYDIFFSWSALHHIENLEGVCENVREALKDRGLLVVQEFIGPNQFQWTNKQIQIINNILSVLPERLRKDLSTGEIITRIERPTIEHMNMTDPSEAIRSSDIIPVLERFFLIKTIRYFGGPLFNPLFNMIIGNFDHDDEKDTALIKMILLTEQILIENNILNHDYAIIIAEKI